MSVSAYDVVIGKVALQHEAAQGIALPGRAVLRPLKEFVENGHLRITESIEVRE